MSIPSHEPTAAAATNGGDTFHIESISNLEKECQTALAKILADPMSKVAVLAEQQMWSSFIKQYKIHLVCTLDFSFGQQTNHVYLTECLYG